MVHRLSLAALVLLASCTRPAAPSPATRTAPVIAPVATIAWGLAVHGGAGTITRDKLTPAREAEIRTALEQALQAGHAVLARGGSSLDAATHAVLVLEDSPHFNAGKGAVFTHDGKHELDAAIMSGRTLAAGAVAGVRTVRNPILLARAIMEHSPHVLLIGDGAEAFAEVAGVNRVEPSYFYTEERWQQLQAKRAADRDASRAAPRDHKFGTVGAVALDQAHALAAATSTGGMTGKRYGRVGDVPIIGAGTYANAACAVSATGHGEYFIRHTVAHDICARRQYLGIPLARAAHDVVMEDLVRVKGDGGIIALDREGTVTMPFNTPGMYRGYIGEDGVPHVHIFKD